MVDPEETIRFSCNELFIQHGSNPVTVKLDEIFDQALGVLEFTCNPKENPTLHMANKIFTMLNDTQFPERNAALKKFRDSLHLISDIDTQNTKSLISNFYLAITAHHDFHHNHYLLSITDLCTDAFVALANECENIFKELMADNSINLSQTAKEQISLLRKAIKTAEQSTMSIEIGNFFANWHTACKDNQITEIRKLYALFINPHFYAKIELQDADLIAMPQQYREAQQGYWDISPYQINRIILHAMLTPTDKWSNAFQAVFLQVYEFVKTDFNHAQSGLDKATKESSYDRVMEQLQYIKMLVTEPERDHRELRLINFLIKPEDARNFYEWYSICMRMDNKSNHFRNIYSTHAVRINIWMIEALNDYVIDYLHPGFKILFMVIFSLPPEYRLTFLKTKLNLSKLKQVFAQDYKHIRDLSALLTPAEFAKFIYYVSTPQTIHLLATNLVDFIRWTHPNERLIVLRNLYSVFGNKIFLENHYKFIRYLSFQEGFIVIDEFLEIDLFSVYKYKMLKFINEISKPEDIYSYVDAFIDLVDLRDHIQDCFDLAMVYSFPAAQKKYVIENVLGQDYIKELIRKRPSKYNTQEIINALRAFIYPLMSVEFWKEMLLSDFEKTALLCPVQMVVDFCVDTAHPERLVFPLIARAYEFPNDENFQTVAFTDYIDHFPVNRLHENIRQNPNNLLVILEKYNREETYKFLTQRLGIDFLRDIYAGCEKINYRLMKFICPDHLNVFIQSYYLKHEINFEEMLKIVVVAIDKSVPQNGFVERLESCITTMDELIYLLHAMVQKSVPDFLAQVSDILIRALITSPNDLFKLLDMVTNKDLYPAAPDAIQAKLAILLNKATLQLHITSISNFQKLLSYKLHLDIDYFSIDYVRSLLDNVEDTVQVQTCVTQMLESVDIRKRYYILFGCLGHERLHKIFPDSDTVNTLIIPYLDDETLVNFIEVYYLSEKVTFNIMIDMLMHINPLHLANYKAFIQEMQWHAQSIDDILVIFGTLFEDDLVAVISHFDANKLITLIKSPQDYLKLTRCLARAKINFEVIRQKAMQKLDDLVGEHVALLVQSFDEFLELIKEEFYCPRELANKYLLDSDNIYKGLTGITRRKVAYILVQFEIPLQGIDESKIAAILTAILSDNSNEHDFTLTFLSRVIVFPELFYKHLLKLHKRMTGLSSAELKRIIGLFPVNIPGPSFGTSSLYQLMNTDINVFVKICNLLNKAGFDIFAEALGVVPNGAAPTSKSSTPFGVLVKKAFMLEYSFANFTYLNAFYQFEILNSILADVVSSPEKIVKWIVNCFNALPLPMQYMYHFNPIITNVLISGNYACHILSQLDNSKLFLFEKFFADNHKTIFTTAGKLSHYLRNEDSLMKVQWVLSKIAFSYLEELLTDAELTITFIHSLPHSTRLEIAERLDLAETITTAPQLLSLLDDDPLQIHGCSCGFYVMELCFTPLEVKEIFAEQLQTVYEQLSPVTQAIFYNYVSAGQTITKEKFINVCSAIPGNYSSFFSTRLPLVYGKALQAKTDAERYKILQEYVNEPATTGSIKDALISHFGKAFFISLAARVEVAPQEIRHA